MISVSGLRLKRASLWVLTSMLLDSVIQISFYLDKEIVTSPFLKNEN